MSAPETDGFDQLRLLVHAHRDTESPRFTRQHARLLDLLLREHATRGETLDAIYATLHPKRATPTPPEAPTDA